MGKEGKAGGVIKSGKSERPDDILFESWSSAAVLSIMAAEPTFRSAGGMSSGSFSSPWSSSSTDAPSFETSERLLGEFRGEFEEPRKLSPLKLRDELPRRKLNVRKLLTRSRIFFLSNVPDMAAAAPNSTTDLYQIYNQHMQRNSAASREIERRTNVMVNWLLGKSLPQISGTSLKSVVLVSPSP